MDVKFYKLFMLAMFAVIECGGKQYKVFEGCFFKTEKVDGVQGDPVTLSSVLLISNTNGDVKFGDPIISGAKVECEILESGRDKKILIFKKKRRQNYRRKNGHRQAFTTLKVIKISL
jgi:large subunit ribosomal protein L21